MFDIGSTELLLIVIVAVVVIGPKDLPRALYKVGQIVGKARGMARHFRTGIDAMVREVELEELEKKWADQNRRIMAEHPPETVPGAVMEALPSPVAGTDTASPPVKPPFVAESASVEKPPYVAEPAPAASHDSPPYVAGPTPAKGDGAT
ncbi:sec-independent protein translocase protein TatB [Sphingobium fontiphilum]|uniref:Sec-independent protein translocase protein TatB n=1 Tax=Sphingobium fontiphilum TaxID=944425 RepID=A0A7W6DMF1_9SPHN|nr:Sec-independent protein translocase protein TatB [Sphingobium fontiphilum]MBB3981674.1 sec-independent protein translocase protein TatB [Sphingobium fontiphilum]